MPGHGFIIRIVAMLKATGHGPGVSNDTMSKASGHDLYIYDHVEWVAWTWKYNFD